MDISRSNIEFYLTLYLDRKLDPVKTAELMLFLTENPDLECLTELPEDFTRHSGNETYAHKHLLKKDFHDVSAIRDANFDEFCIAKSEGLLDDADEKRLDDYIAQHPEKEKDARIYGLLKLEADPMVRYPGRSALKKPIPWHGNRRTWITVTGIAATVALMALLIKGGPDTLIQPAEQYVAQSPPGGNHPELQQGAQPEVSQGIRQNPAAQNGAEISPETEIRIQPAIRLSAAMESDPPEITSSQTQNPLPVNMPETMAPSDLRGTHNDMPLASMDPLHSIQLASVDPSADLEYGPGAGKTHDRLVSSLYALINDDETGQQGLSLANFIRDLDPWKTALYAVKGFNALTESRITLNKTTDNQGKMNGLVIGTESYTLLTKGSE